MNYQIAELFDRIVGGLPPTAMRFFTPLSKFWSSIAKVSGESVIVEFGSGKGDIVSEGRELGLKISGCDLNAGHAEMVKGVHRMNAVRFPLQTGIVAIACRPDHSGWVEMALTRALDEGCIAIYVGLNKNVERDLFYLLKSKHRRDVINNVGKENERMWVFYPYQIDNLGDRNEQ